jgi:hypothetical protein
MQNSTSIKPDLLALPPTVKNAFFSPNVSSIRFKNRVFSIDVSRTSSNMYSTPFSQVCTLL